MNRVHVLGRFVVLSFSSLLAACASSAPPAPAPASPAGGPAAPAAPRADAARAAVRDVVAKQTAAIARGDVDTWLAWHAPDVLWVGTGADEVIVGKPAVAGAMHGWFDPVSAKGGHFTVKQDDVAIGTTDDGRAAWLAESFALTVVSDRSTTIPFHHTALFAEDHGAWRVLAEAWTVPVAREEAIAGAKAGKWKALVDVGAGIAPGAGALVDAVTRDAPRASALPLRAHGSARAALAPSGGAGWVFTNVDATLPDGAGGSVVVPFRALAVVTRAGDGGWSVVQLDLSQGT
jgi:ketosteroid isomerase-like protein